MSEDLRILQQRLDQAELKADYQEKLIAELCRKLDQMRGELQRLGGLHTRSLVSGRLESQLEQYRSMFELQTAELAERVALLERQRREAFRHRQLLEACLWGVAGLAVIGLLGYKSDRWDFDTALAKELVGAAAVALTIFKTYQARERR